MLKILCPTDFSEHSLKAIDFAFNLATATDAEIYLLTTYTERRTGSSFKSIKRHLQESNERELNDIKMKMITATKFTNPVICRVQEGYVLDEILSSTKSDNIDLIVLGTQGNKSTSNRIFGSVSAGLIKKTQTPVLAIPSDTKYNWGHGPILLTIDNKDVMMNSSFNILNLLCEKLDKKINILHLDSKNSEQETSFKPGVNNFIRDYTAEIILDKSSDPVAYIEEYISNNPVEMLVMIRRQHSFLERLLVKSSTDREIANTKVPLLIIPE